MIVIESAGVWWRYYFVQESDRKMTSVNFKKDHFSKEQACAIAEQVSKVVEVAKKISKYSCGYFLVNGIDQNGQPASFYVYCWDCKLICLPTGNNDQYILTSNSDDIPGFEALRFF